MTRELNERQEKLLDLLFNGYKWRDAMDEAGYSSSQSRTNIMKSENFKRELQNRLEAALSLNGPAAVSAMEEALEQPHLPGMGLKLKAAGEFLDRSGLGKVQRVQHEGEAMNALFVLPAKEQPNDE